MEPTSRRSRSRISRFRKRESDRSGFNYREIEMVRDNSGFPRRASGVLVGPDEFDAPPPNVQPIGGEGDISPGYTNPYFLSYSNNLTNRTIQYVTSSTAINFVTAFDEAGDINPIAQWVYIAGSNSAVTLSANPQVTAGQQNNQFTIQCIGSSVTLQNGNGLSLKSIFTMNSGDILNLFYSATDSLWHETSRGSQYGQ